MTFPRTIWLAALAIWIATAMDASAATPCRAVSGAYPHGQIAEGPAIIGVVTLSVTVPAYRCSNGVWTCIRRCGTEADATYIFRDGRLQQAPVHSR